MGTSRQEESRTSNKEAEAIPSGMFSSGGSTSARVAHGQPI